MGKRIIECAVNNEYVIGGGVPIGAEGSHDDVVLRVAFDNSWIGRNIYATFRDALGENPTLVALLPSLLVQGESMVYDVNIPGAVRKTDGKMSVTFSGYTIVGGVEEEEISNTAATYFRVLPSTYKIMDDDSIDATLAQQLQNEIRELAELCNSLSERLDRLEVTG